MKKRTAWILVAGVAMAAVGAAFAGALLLLVRAGGRGGPLLGKTHLYLKLEGDLPEQPPSSDLEAFLERRPPSLRTLVDSLDRARRDPKVAGLVVRMSPLSGVGWGKVQELRDALGRFRESGKPAYAYLEFCGNKEYYLATACSKIYAVPTALVGVAGLEAEVTFLRGTLDKLGVQAQFQGVGKYKNAPNQYTEPGFTPPHREQMQSLLDSLFEHYVEAIAKGRGKTLEEVREIVDQGPFDAREAVEMGLVDELLYRDQVEGLLDSGGPTTPARYLRSSEGFSFDGRPKVALVYAVGDIVPGNSESGSVIGDLAGADTVSGALRQARTDAGVKAIVLRVDSPGGFGPAADVIWREVRLAREAKPVVVSMGDYAASGGYYVSMGSDAIVAQPGTITGSIGVFGGKFNLRGFYEKVGITKEILTRGRHAAIYSEYRPWTAEERAKIQSQMESFYEDFVSRAADARGMSVDDVDAVAQGRVWTGVQAKEKGLVDALGGLDTALDLAKQRAGIRKEAEVSVVVYPERKGFFEALMERQDENLEAYVPADVRSLARWVRLLRDGAPLARLPFELSVR